MIFCPRTGVYTHPKMHNFKTACLYELGRMTFSYPLGDKDAAAQMQHKLPAQPLTDNRCQSRMIYCGSIHTTQHTYVDHCFCFVSFLYLCLLGMASRQRLGGCTGEVEEVAWQAGTCLSEHVAVVAGKVQHRVAAAATEFTWRQQLFTHLADEIGWPLRIDDAQQRSACRTASPGQIWRMIVLAVNSPLMCSHMPEMQGKLLIERQW